MLRPAFKNILLFFFVKYFVFYILLMFKNKDYSLIQLNNLRNYQDVFYYLWIFLFLPVVTCLLFSAPIYLILKIRRAIYFVILITVIFIVEYVLYTYLASQADLMNGVYNEAISVLVLWLFFFKHIKLIFRKSRIDKT